MQHLLLELYSSPLQQRSALPPLLQLDSRGTRLFQLHAPLRSGEHVAFRRYSDFVHLDTLVRGLLDGTGPRLPCASAPALPPLPPKTLPWQSTTESKLVAARWGGLQVYLDAVLDRVGESGAAWEALRDFLCLPC